MQNEQIAQQAGFDNRPFLKMFDHFFYRAKRWDLGICTFIPHFLSLALFKNVIVQSLFLKCNSKINFFCKFSHIHSFLKSNFAIALFCTLESKSEFPGLMVLLIRSSFQSDSST